MIRRASFAVMMLVMFVSPALGEVNIVATLPWIGSIAREIGKDKVNITALVKPGQDPHYVEAKPSMILAASKADAIMYNGLDLEVGYLPLIIRSSRNQRIQPGQKGNLDCSQYVNAIEKPHADINRSMGDVHPFGNPHYHFSPKNIGRVAEGMANTFSEIDPGNAEFYRNNLRTFRERLMEKQKQWSAIPLKGKRYISYHKLLEYLALEYGFRIEGYVEPKPGIPPSAGHIADMVETLKKTRPDAILATNVAGKKEAEFLSQKTGVKAVVLPQDVGAIEAAKDWFGMMDEALKALQ